jgi:hypothetical protein
MHRFRSDPILLTDEVLPWELQPEIAVADEPAPDQEPTLVEPAEPVIATDLGPETAPDAPRPRRLQDGVQWRRVAAVGVLGLAVAALVAVLVTGRSPESTLHGARPSAHAAGATAAGRPRVTGGETRADRAGRAKQAAERRDAQRRAARRRQAAERRAAARAKRRRAARERRRASARRSTPAQPPPPAPPPMPQPAPQPPAPPAPPPHSEFGLE